MANTKQLMGQRIKECRKQKRLTQEKLAEQVGVDTRHISRIETGAHYPSLDTLEAIARALGCPIADFFTTHDEDSEDSLRFFLIDLGRTLQRDELRRVVRVVRASL